MPIVDIMTLLLHNSMRPVDPISLTHLFCTLPQPRLRALASRDTRRCAICDDFFGWCAARTLSVVVSASLSVEVLTVLRLAIAVGSRVCARQVTEVRAYPPRLRAAPVVGLKLCNTDCRMHYGRGTNLKANRPSCAGCCSRSRAPKVADSGRQQLLGHAPHQLALRRLPSSPSRPVMMPAVVSGQLELVLERLDEAQSLNSSLQEFIAHLECRNIDLEEQLDAARGLRSELELVQQAAGRFRIESSAAHDGALTCLTGVPTYADSMAFCHSLSVPSSWFCKSTGAHGVSSSHTTEFTEDWSQNSGRLPTGARRGQKPLRRQRDSLLPYIRRDAQIICELRRRVCHR